MTGWKSPQALRAKILSSKLLFYSRIIETEKMTVPSVLTSVLARMGFWK